MEITKPTLHSALVLARKALVAELKRQEQVLVYDRRVVALRWTECDKTNLSEYMKDAFIRLNILKGLQRKTERKIVKLKDALRVLKSECRKC